jgi:hypothetical protein
VKNSDPTKNVHASVAAPTAVEYDGTTPSANKNDPIANSTAIHQPSVAGCHQTVRPVSRSWPLRCLRELHRRRVPSSRRYVSRVTNGPTFECLSASQLSGTRKGAREAVRI